VPPKPNKSILRTAPSEPCLKWASGSVDLDSTF